MRVLAALCLLAACAVAVPLSSTLDLPSKNEIECGICRHAFGALLPLFKSNKTLERVEETAKFVCLHIGGAGFCKGKKACEDLCPGIVAAYGPAVVTVLLQNGNIGATELCDLMKVCTSHPTPPHHVLPPGPIPGAGLIVQSNLSNTAGQKEWRQWSRPQTGNGTFIHLTDIHLDVQYIEGSNAQCGEPTCCRARNGPPGKGQRAAGHWGDYGCDTSPELAQSLWDEMRRRHVDDVDFAVVTGDEPTHDVWMQTAEHNVAAINAVSSGVMTAFTDVPTFFCLGNHASAPADLFEPGKSQFLFNAIAQDWAHWLPEDAVRTLQMGGYYAARAKPGLIVIAMHTTVLTADDLWLRINETAHDFTGQIPWLNDTLSQVRALGEKAYIIGHARPTEFIEPIRSAFYQIAKANEDIITGYLFGHTHPFELSLMRMDDNEAPFAVTYAAGSVTTFTDLNPGFRKWNFDRDSTQLTGWEEYWVDLQQANALPKEAPLWALQYEAPAYFNLTSIDAASWQDFAHRMVSDVDLAQRWNRAWSKGGPAPAPTTQRSACSILQLADCSKI